MSDVFNGKKEVSKHLSLCFGVRNVGREGLFYFSGLVFVLCFAKVRRKQQVYL